MTTRFHENKNPTMHGIRRRRLNPDRPRSRQNYYFTDTTQAKIVEYQNTEDPRLRERIFERFIYQPFVEIATNLINRYNYVSFAEREDTAQECAAYLFEHLEKYDASKGYKAFSYFSVCARNWLSGRAKAASKHNKRHVSASWGLVSEAKAGHEDLALTQRDIEIYHNHATFGPPQGRLTPIDFSRAVVRLWNEMEEEVRMEERMGSDELLIIQACREICEQAEEIDIHKHTEFKRVIQEKTGLSKKEYLTAMRNLREVYGLVRQFNTDFADYWSDQ